MKTALLSFLLLVSTLSATTIGGSAGQSFRPFNEFYGSTYSDDGEGLSFSHFLQKTGQFLLNADSPEAQLEFWGTDTGDHKPTDSYFTGSANFSLLFEIAGLQNSNWIGACSTVGPICQEIANGPQSAPLTVPITITGPWALVLVPGYGGSTPTYAEMLTNGFWQNGIGAAQFAIFRYGSDYFVAMEDQLIGDSDYNDGAGHVSSVPEPANFALLGAALLALAVMRKIGPDERKWSKMGGKGK